MVEQAFTVMLQYFICPLAVMYFSKKWFDKKDH